MDEMRAKRHRQEQERKQREKARAELDDRAQAMKELLRARKHQEDSRIQGLKVLAMQDLQEWKKINRESAEMQAKQDAVAQAQKNANALHQKALLQQIDSNATETERLLQ